MSDLKKLGMTELIALHNQLADQLGVSNETSFKSLAAARAAVETLQAKVNKAMNPETSTDAGTADTADTTATAGAPFESGTPTGTMPPQAPIEDRSKYNSSGLRGPNQGVGAFSKELIAQSKTNAEVLASVLAKFPGAKTTTGCIAFYRTAMTKAGKAAPVSGEQLRAQAAELIAKAEAAEKLTAEKLTAEKLAAAQAAADAADAADAAATASAATETAPV